MQVYSIYRVTNNINGRSYIGFTKNFSKRKYSHIAGSRNPKNPFHRALKKHGKENFKWEILEQSTDKNFMQIRETYYINTFDTYNTGYNQTTASLGNIAGRTLSAQERIDCSVRMIENNPMKHSEVRERVSSSVSALHREGVYAHTYHDPIRSKRISESKTGSRNPMFGNRKAADHMNTTSTCGKCGITTNKGNIIRWHNENCRR